MSTKTKKLQATAQLFHHHGSMGHWQSGSDPWPTWPTQKWWPIRPMTHDPLTHFHLCRARFCCVSRRSALYAGTPKTVILTSCNKCSMLPPVCLVAAWRYSCTMSSWTLPGRAIEGHLQAGRHDVPLSSRSGTSVPRRPFHHSFWRRFSASYAFCKPTSAHRTSLSTGLNTYGRRAFSIAGPTVWNSLLDELRDTACSSDNFKPLSSFLKQSCIAL